MIEKQVTESGIEMSRICNFLKCGDGEIMKMYAEANLSTNILLRWSKLLKYDFFRLYSQHLILYSPPENRKSNKDQGMNNESILPKFRKNIYTNEIKDFILEKINRKEMTVYEIIEKYSIPKTTLYKWIHKSS